MTDRERWTVYPLLFMALGITVKDKIVKLVDVDNIRCSKLVVTDRGGKDRVVIASNPAGGIVQLHGDKNVRNIVLGYADNLAGLIFVDAHGHWTSPFAVPTSAPHQAPADAQAEPKGGAAKNAPSGSGPPTQQQEPTPGSQ